MMTSRGATIALRRRVILDFVALFTVGFPILMFKMFVQPYERGFFCNDMSIRHPYLKSTVPTNLLYVLGFGLSLFWILTVEIYRYHVGGSRSTNPRICNVRIVNQSIPNWLWNVYIFYGIFLFGAASNQLLTDLGKYTIGRLRPHFYERCRPNVDCSLPENQFRYILNATCTGEVHKDMRLSFPSGHSSFIVFSMVYVILYLHARFTCDISRLLRPWIQLMCFCIAAFTALSRVSDYKHHPTDVLAGSVLGAIVCFAIVRYVAHEFKVDEEYDHWQLANHNSPTVSRTESDAATDHRATPLEHTKNNINPV